MMKKNLSVFILSIAVLGIAIWWFDFGATVVESSAARNIATTNEVSNPELWRAYLNRLTKLQISGKGIVIKVLRDDLKGSRHQRILLSINPQQTLLIAHNIDLAPRIMGLQSGDMLEFYGEYAWNNKGGVLHWTHRDPRGKHLNGWLKYQGRFYQ